MVGITLTPERIRAAPPEVRRWLEREIALSFGLAPETQISAPPSPHLIACSIEEAGAIYAAIRGMLPVANVFFELGREGGRFGQDGIEAHNFADILRHTRLQSTEQLATCLQIIDEVVHQLRKDASATICALDRQGNCVLATETRRSIASVWKQLLAGRDLDQSATAGASETPLQDEHSGFSVPPGKQASSGDFDRPRVAVSMDADGESGDATSAFGDEVTAL